MSARWVDTALERPRWRATVARRLHRRLQVGAEYNPAAGEVAPNGTLFLLFEREHAPGLFLGTSSDRIGSPEGTQCAYLTATKFLPLLRMAPYVSLNYSEWDAAWNMPFGLTADLGQGIVLRPMYDGERTHTTLGVTRGRATATALWAWLERVGISVSLGF